MAGIAAAISAVFRTPLGAALLATEMLHRDDFAADALVPSIFASVVSYSVVIARFGETTLFGALPRFPFTIRHLAPYAATAVGGSIATLGFVGLLRRPCSSLLRHPRMSDARLARRGDRPRPVVGGAARERARSSQGVSAARVRPWSPRRGGGEADEPPVL